MTIAIGIPVFKRTEALKRCLESISDHAIDRVIVADNGDTRSREHLYTRDWGFDLTTIELEYDSGIGACRSAIAEALTEDYLIVVDNDMIIPPTTELNHLQKALEYDSTLGAVSGLVVEQSHIRSGCADLHEETSIFGDKFIVHSIRSEPTVEWVEPTLPIARFDKLTNAAMVRRKCIEDYSWDSQFPQGEHLDFYLGHYHQTDWEFAVCPAVIFDHQKGRYSNYREEVRDRGENYNKKRKITEERYLNKWGYKYVEYGAKPDWIDTEHKPIIEEMYRILLEKVPLRYIIPFKRTIVSISSMVP